MKLPIFMKIRRHYWAFSLSRHLHPVTKATGVKLGPWQETRGGTKTDWQSGFFFFRAAPTAYGNMEVPGLGVELELAKSQLCL